jgi:hypothetical protein
MKMIIIFSSYKLPNATLFLSSMTYLYITFKNLTLYGSRCICFKFEYKSLMGINEDNKGFFFFKIKKLLSVTLLFLNKTYFHITFKNFMLYGSRFICFKCKYKLMMGINEGTKVFFLII